MENEWNSEHTQLQLICVTGAAQCKLNYLYSVSLGYDCLNPKQLVSQAVVMNIRHSIPFSIPP